MSVPSDSVLEHLVYHVFLPPKLPQEEQEELFQRTVDLALVRSTQQAIEKFRVEMGHLYNYIEVPLEKAKLGKDMKNMAKGGILSLYIKAQNAAVIIRKQAHDTTFEVFEVQAQTEDIMSTPGRVQRSFPGPAVELPSSVAGDRDFINEVANILSQMNVEVFDKACPTTHKAGTTVRESRNSINPNYFIQFFLGYLRGMGVVADPPRVDKRVADEVLWKDAKNPWRRSPIWLVIRVALQTSLNSTTTYKQFMAYHHATIISQCYKQGSFSSDLLHSMRVKMARRLFKLKETAPPFLVDFAKATANETQDLLQKRWDLIQSGQSQSRSPNISGAHLESAIYQTLPQSHRYLERVFEGRSSHTHISKFSPNHSPRLENVVDFSRYAIGGLSRTFGNDGHLALFDFEASVFINLASWVASQSNLSEASVIMSSCFRQYLKAAKSYYKADTSDQSVMILTLIRIWMAIDELAIKECPMLTGFSPELPSNILDPLLLRTSQHIKQASLVQQYIRARHAGALASNPSVFSDEVTPTCFTVQYYKSSSWHQQMKRDIKSYAQDQKNRKRWELIEKNDRFYQLCDEIEGMPCTDIIHIPTDASQVFLDNALQFQLYDIKGDAWAAGPFPGISFTKYGTFKLPSGSLYRHLEYTLGSTTHSSNQVLADQHDCPIELSLHEHIAFGTLRSGARLQWMNILRGLEEDLLSFSSDEVWMLHTQAAWQMGPMTDKGSLEWHQDLGDLKFGLLLVSQCMRVLDRVKANWLQAKSVLTIVSLVNRLIASLPSTKVVRAACKLLRDARAVTLKWLDELIIKLQAATLEENIIMYRQRVCEMAAICRQTYNTEPRHMRLLLSNPEDYTALVKASIVLYDNQPPDMKNAPKSLQIVLCRDRRFAHQITQNMLASINRGEDILSSPLSEIWPDYRQGPLGWETQEVHLNLITGQLLINGEPLGRLPREYVEHPTYIRLFGQKIRDVVPAKSAGMEFATRSRVHGYQVSFALKESKHLIIQAQKDDQLYELIPHEELSEDFPQLFSEDYHHWADIKQKTVEFRPIQSPWSANSYRWLLRFDSSRTTLENSAGASLVDVRSTLFQSLAHSIGPLESNRYLHVTRSVEGVIEVDLPRMKLSFFINDDRQVESRNFRNQVLDENQSAGTLFGLRNQLVLRAKDTLAQSLPRSRSVLIPDGVVAFTTNDHHVSVSIHFESRRNVDIYRYKIDGDLGYLATDAGLTSRIFKTYLHALTSHCLPDPLTGRTGTEEALHELSQASTSSFEQLNLKQVKLLTAIGQLSPKRQYYPANMQRMETTHWVNLPSLSQHFAFSYAATQILRRADTLQLFHPLEFELDEYITSLETTDKLTRRAMRRTAVYYPSDTTGFNTQILGSTPMLDRVSPGRDSLTGQWEEEGQSAGWASGLAYQNWEKPVFKLCNLVSLVESWGTLNDTGKHDTLSYRSSWFSLSLKSSWITFYNLLRRASTTGNKYMLCACLASVGFGEAVPTDLIPVFVAFATNPKFRSLEPPSHTVFNFEDRYEPKLSQVEVLAITALHSIKDSPASDLTQKAGETNFGWHSRREKYYNSNYPIRWSQFVSSLMNQWPRNPQPPIQLHSPSADLSGWFDVESCLESTRQYYSSCMWNVKMRSHLHELQGVLTSQPTSTGTTFYHTPHQTVKARVASQRLGDPWSTLNFSAFMRNRSTSEPTDAFSLPKVSAHKDVTPNADTSRLQKLFAEFQQSSSSLNRLYATDLDESRQELDSKPNESLPRQLPFGVMTKLEETREICKEKLTRSFQRLSSTLSAQNDIERVVVAAGIWPRITPRTILRQLSFPNRSQIRLLSNWRSDLIGYAQAFTHYQRYQRLIALAESNNTAEFYKELDSASDKDLNSENPDWLLVQIDSNFAARAVQRQVAKEMISPSSLENTVLQLNMGEGKSSVVVPIVASTLADSSRLVRVVVLKPLWRQMFDLLVNRLSGLSNRRIYYLPFGRHIEIDNSIAQKLRSLYEECMHEGGILLAQPEHILSFKLMGIDRLITWSDSSDMAVADSLRSIQKWLKAHTRDILDESDEILHVRYQLVYTVGDQQPLDDHPDRWTTTQQLLHLAAEHIEQFQQKYANGLLHKYRDHGRFPKIRIMPDCLVEAEQSLIKAIAADVRNGRLLNLSCDRLPLSVQNNLIEFFTENQLPFLEYESLRQSCGDALWKGLLLVRGLLASGILVFALKHKHYRVDYGLDLSRSLLAVPYRAKDTPSLRAEFGHPDVAVVLTCFSYYYQGLTNQQLDLCFELLFKLDNPTLEYEQWVQRNSATPDDLRQLNGVNIKDREQFTDRLVPAFSHNSATIDFFLSSVVFPKEAKEFPEKLATSGWDLAEKKSNFTTGFSGTNDNRYLLPTSITQVDPVKQLSTNALVLTYLLQPENNHYVPIRDREGGTLSSKEFVELLVEQTPEVRVLLDVGAQMLELQNDELVRYWLDLKQDIEAAVYFNDRDELVVLPQNGTPVLLSTSPFAQQLDKCIVYLDDGHTRGTDLELPRDTRCMRMRKLGHGQSVIFAAPPEIDTLIRNASPKPIKPEDMIDTLDVLRWAMLETCKDLEHHVSHWAHQGIEFNRRLDAETHYGRTQDITAFQKGWTAPESRTLEKMYGVPSPKALSKRVGFMRRAFEVPELRKGLEKLGVKKLDDPYMDEEQEREVYHEVEQEQQTQRPPKGHPKKHSVHSEVRSFIKTGKLPANQSGILPLFHPLRASNGQMFKGWSSLLFASADFLQTVTASPTDHLSEYMRPVNWIVSGSGNVRVVLSPYEVNELLPSIRKQSAVQLHVYAPRVSLAMLSFSDLQFYSIPATPSSHVSSRVLSTAQLQLDLFAGQLYLPSYQDYTLLCASLGLFILSENEDDLKIEVESDGFVKPRHRGQLVERHPEYSNCQFTDTPVPSLKDLIGRRRKGMKYLLTHVGQILHARSLTPKSFQKAAL
ncbi:large low complexity protein, putative, partial [Rhizoctonia solani AG-3 Rhs1AP]